MLKDGGQTFSRLALRALTSRPLWLALGVANLAAGVVIALRPVQSFDAGAVAQWCRDWLIHGVNPYPGSGLRANYPPYALVFLSPLALLPAGLLPAAWVIISVGLAILVGWLGLGAVSPGRSEHGLHLPIGFFLAWESLRIGLGLGQFTLVALASGLAAVVYQGKIARAILLAIAMTKPQIGVAFVLWTILEGSVAAAVLAALPLVVATILFAARLGQSPLAISARYIDVLRQELAAPGFREGALELRPLIHALVTRPMIADTIHLGIAAGSLTLLVVAARRMSPAGRSLFLLPLTCVWTLMSVYHPAYDLVLLWPAAVAFSVLTMDVRPKVIGVGALAALQLVLLVDIPGLWWKFNGRPALHFYEGAIAAPLQHFDRLLVLGLFAALITLSMRWQPDDAAVTLPGNTVPVS